MKLSYVTNVSEETLDFLTHTVQMKLFLFPGVSLKLKLLNPHGSDETLSEKKERAFRDVAS